MDLLKTLVLLVLTSILVQTQVLSQNFSYEIDSTTAIGCIGHFNADNVPDTLFYKNIAPNESFPSFISWGVNKASFTSRTKFHYPNWVNIKSSFHVQLFNDDTINDIIAIIRGQIVTNIGSRTFLKDTAIAVAIMGSYGLDTVRMVDFSMMPVGNFSNYYCVKLFVEKHFIEPRTISTADGNVIYYRIKGVTTPPFGNVPQRLATNISLNGETENCSITVNIFPNPVSDAANVSFNNIEAGDYTIRVTDMKGDVYKTVAQRFDSSGDIVRRIDLDELPDGVYLITVSSAGSTIGTYKIVILH